MLKRLHRWWKRERDVWSLARLDDRLLSDIGLSRDDLRERLVRRTGGRQKG